LTRVPHGGSVGERMNPPLLKLFERVKTSIFQDRLVIVVPGVAYFLMLGMVPALAALLLIYGLVADPIRVHEHLALLSPAIPPAAADLLSAQIDRIAAERGTAGWGVLVSIGLTLWAGSYAIGVIMAALNIVYDTDETRGFIKLTVLRLALTLGAIALGLIAIGVIALVPLVLQVIPLPPEWRSVLSLLRWPILLLLGTSGLAMLFWFGPDRRPPAFRWISWGSAAAAILWVIASSLFSWYVARFDVYNEFFGAFGAIIVLMLWVLMSAFAILLGAEIDAALEHERSAAAQSP
jgi:membrane protein